MRVACSWSSVECRCWEDRTVLERYLSSFEYSRIVVESDEHEQEFYSLVVRPDSRAARTRQVALGVCSEGHGLEPEILTLPELDLILIGANSEVAAIDLTTGRDAFRVPLDALFYYMVRIQGGDRVLVIHEIGVVLLSKDGQVLWTFARDIVTDAWIEGSTLHLSFMDADPVALDLATGE